MQISEEDFRKYLSIIKGLEHRSVNTYTNRFKIIKRWLLERSIELSKRAIGDFLFSKRDKEELGHAAINTYIQTIQHIQGCYRYQDIKCDFADDLKCLPKTQSNIVPLSKDELNRLLSTRLSYKNRNGVDNSNLDFKYLTFTAFIAYTGCRFGEAASLIVANLDIDNGRVTLIKTKNKKNRYLFLIGPLKDQLRKLIEGKNPEDLVFTNGKGKNIYYGDFNDNLRLRAKKAGITKRVHAHLLRHTYGTELYKANHDIAMVAKLLGHEDVQTTIDTYIHLDTEEIQRAAGRHPFLEDYITPEEKLDNFRSLIETFGIHKDKRFDYDLTFGTSELDLKVKIKSL